MSDEKLRELERRWKESGALEEEIACLRRRRRHMRSLPLKPVVRFNPEAPIVHFKVAYVSPSDSKKCPATRALLLLHQALRPWHPGELTVIPTQGDRTLFFVVDFPRFDMGTLRARVGVYCASGSVFNRATRRLIARSVSGVVFVPTLVEGRTHANAPSARDLVEDLRDQGLNPDRLPFVLQWLPGDPRPELSPESPEHELHLPFLARFNTDRTSGEGIENALFELLERARDAHLMASAPEILARQHEVTDG